MRLTGCLQNVAKTMTGDLLLTFAVEDDREAQEQLSKLSDGKLTIIAEAFKAKRSGEANRYLWVLCDKIATALGTTKDAVYLMELKDAGVFEDYELPKDALDIFKRTDYFRLIEVLYEFEATTDIDYLDGEQFEKKTEMVGIRCWRGSHVYDTAQMSKLLNEVVQTAKGLGIETATPDEIAHTLSLWRPRE